MKGIMTSKGLVPYKQHPDYPWLEMPVKVRPYKWGERDKEGIPYSRARHPGVVTKECALVYAMPGGGEYVDF